MAGKITALKIQKRDQQRVNVYLDGQFAFAVTALVAASLKKGQQLGDAEIENLKRGDELEKAYSRAVRYLGFRPRSQMEIVRYLGGKGYSPEVVDRVVSRLLDEQYLDDDAFARYWLENREQFRPRGQRFLRYELRQKGIAEAIIAKILGPVDETASAWQAVEGKLHRWHNLPEEEFRQKVIGFLNRRGFNYEISQEIFERAWRSRDLSE